MKTKSILTSIVAAAMLLLIPSCGTTPNATLVSFAKIGMAYIASSQGVKPADKVYIDFAFDVIITGKLDKDKLIALAQAKLGDKLSPDQVAQITDLIAGLQSGQIDKATLLTLGKTALNAYAASHGIPPEQSAAVMALIELFAANLKEPVLAPVVEAPPTV